MASPKQGFFSNDNNPYIYQDNETQSMAIGLDLADNGKLKIEARATAGGIYPYYVNNV